MAMSWRPRMVAEWVLGIVTSDVEIVMTEYSASPLAVGAWPNDTAKAMQLPNKTA